MTGVWGMHSLTKELADVFAEDSENDTTFCGFSEGEFSDKNSSFDDDDQPGLFPKEQKTTSKLSAAAARPFKLRVALRSAPPTQHSTDDETGSEEKRTANRVVKRAVKPSQAKEKKHVKFEDVEMAVTRPSPSDEPGSDSADDVRDSFLAKREQNIKANQAMLAQLMADLQKMPGGAGLLKKQAGKQKTKERSSHPPRSRIAGGEPRRNPERMSRRQTRSMGGCEDSSAFKEEELELSLEEELLEVRRAPQHRGTPRSNQCKPHSIRPVKDITEDELQLVADNMSSKVYNKVTGSTCHQCRQKTVDTKTCCRSEDCRGIQGQFCGPCLRNRYGEDVRKALLDPGGQNIRNTSQHNALQYDTTTHYDLNNKHSVRKEWKCPPCRGICNCSFCRQREGRCPTGILFPLAQYHGFSDVHSYLSSLRNKLKSKSDDVEM